MMFASLMTTAVYAMDHRRNKITSARTMRRLVEGERLGYAQGMCRTQRAHASSPSRRRLAHFDQGNADLIFEEPSIAQVAPRPDQRVIPAWQNPPEDTRKLWQKLFMQNNDEETEKMLIRCFEHIEENSNILCGKDWFPEPSIVIGQDIVQDDFDTEDALDRDFDIIMLQCANEALNEQTKFLSNAGGKRRLLPVDKLSMIQDLVKNTRSTVRKVFRRKVLQAMDTRQSAITKAITKLEDETGTTMSQSLHFLAVAKDEFESYFKKIKTSVQGTETFNWTKIEKSQEGDKLEEYKQLKAKVDFDEVRGFPTDIETLKKIVDGVRSASKKANKKFADIEKEKTDIPPAIPEVTGAQQKSKYHHCFFKLYGECEDKLEDFEKEMNGLHLMLKCNECVLAQLGAPMTVNEQMECVKCPKLHLAPVKGKVRAMNKFLYKYNSSAAGLTDLLRASFVFNSVASIKAAVRTIEDYEGFEKATAENVAKFTKYQQTKYSRIVKLKDRFTNRPSNGNSDVLINVIWQGLVVEIQLHHKELYELKNGDLHHAYEKRRYLGHKIDDIIFPQ